MWAITTAWAQLRSPRAAYEGYRKLHSVRSQESGTHQREMGAELKKRPEGTIVRDVVFSTDSANDTVSIIAHLAME